ncbi:MAG TPA: ABC transporter permease [Candidatus Hydrogenedentes bacterium]|nr:ABC transporter permease [Candidatus Hydrogenedentota bacterium]
MTSRSHYKRILVDYVGLSSVLAGMILFFGLQTDYFFSLTTFRTIANQIPDAVIIAVGMTYVLIIAGIDLSVGSILALGAAVLGVCLVKGGLPLWLSVGACVGVGLACGAVNGFMTIRWQLPSFIVTLGMMEAARGGAYLVTNSKTQYISGIERIYEANIGGLSMPFLLAIAVVVAAQIVLSGTVFGRHMFAVGANEESARLSGIRVRLVKFTVFVISGGLAALAAVIHCSRLAAADPNSGAGYELQAIAAVVIGGTSLMGGRGSVINTFFGVVIIAVLGTGLVQIGAEEPIKRLVTGAVIVIAVIADYYRHRLRSRD